MHQQIRSQPALSPADLQAYLSVLADAGIKLESAGGSNIEFGGGEFAFGVADGDEDMAIAVLEQAGYSPRLVPVDVFPLTDGIGQLLEYVEEVRKLNAQRGWVIRDIALGVPEFPGSALRVQIYSEPPR